MLTENFYPQLAAQLRPDSQAWDSINIAVGSGGNNWEVNPPLLRRNIDSLVNEVVRKSVQQSDIHYLDDAGQETREPTTLIRFRVDFLANEGSGTLRECGLFSGEGETAVMVAYFIFPRIEKSLNAILQRSIILDLTPGRALAQENSTRFLGNAKTEELHDLENEQPNCQVDEIRIDRRHSFDSIESAQTLGYDFCAYCFGRELSER